jgi:uncharacterized membrane protein
MGCSNSLQKKKKKNKRVIVTRRLATINCFFLLTFFFFLIILFILVCLFLWVFWFLFTTIDVFYIYEIEKKDQLGLFDQVTTQSCWLDRIIVIIQTILLVRPNNRHFTNNLISYTTFIFSDSI